MKIKESELIKLVEKVVLREYNEYNERRPGSIGSHANSDGSLNSIPQTSDINIEDKGIATPEKREQWKKISRLPSRMSYPNGDTTKMSAHIRHLKRLYGNRISFFSYNNGEYVFYNLDGKVGYLTDNALSGY